MRPHPSPKTIAIALWGTVGTLVLLLDGIVRLSMTVASILSREVPSAAEWIFGSVWTILITYTEGYKAFQQRFSPRVVARSMHLGEQGRFVHIALAPMYAMALIHATPRRLIANWIILAGIVSIIVLVRALPPVWRAMIDAGVVCALSWGSVAMLIYLVRALRGNPPEIPLDLPGEEGSKSVF